MAGFKTLFCLWKDYNLVNEEIGYVNENVLGGDEFSHNRCSIGLLQILVTTRVSIPSHLLVVPHTERLVGNVMVKSCCIFVKSILIKINIERVILKPCSRRRCC